MIRILSPVADPEVVLRCVARGERPFFLDGGSDADSLGRYSFAGCDPEDGFVWRLGDAGDPYALLQAALARFVYGPVDTTPWPYAIGYLSYELGAAAASARIAQKIATWSNAMPAVDVASYPALWRFDRVTRRAEILARDLRAAEQLLARLRLPPRAPSALRVGAPQWEISAASYRDKVERIRAEILAGNVYQVNLSQRVHFALDDALAVEAYLRVRALSPAPLGGFLKTAGAAILCNSPELLVHVRGREIETRPIKGTIRRASDGNDDAALKAELGTSEKDQAEHLMIVDLERNDLGRIAKTGSVRVEGFERLVPLATLHHMVSTVKAELLPGIGLADILRATFPGGSITGAPKIAAMELIAELEASPRGIYCGALGWFGAGAEIALNLPIRTAVLQNNRLTLAVGGGIVSDSTPEGELAETQLKAVAFLRALS